MPGALDHPLAQFTFSERTTRVRTRVIDCIKRPLNGSEGTIYVDRQQNVFAGRRGDRELSEVPNPPEQQATYRVEEQFTNAIRGTEDVTMVPFETGVHYMEWTEAVFRSAQTGQAVSLPL
jgi:predicted dehydrogenase